MVEQGDIITIRDIRYPMLVVSKDTYNKTGHLIACPILPPQDGKGVCVSIEVPTISGYVMCDNPRQFDWSARGVFIKGHAPLAVILTVLDMIQSLFEFI